MLSNSELLEMQKRHKAVDADPRFTDKIAHSDRARLLAHVVVLPVLTAPQRQAIAYMTRLGSSKAAAISRLLNAGIDHLDIRGKR